MEYVQLSVHYSDDSTYRRPANVFIIVREAQGCLLLLGQ